MYLVKMRPEQIQDAVRRHVPVLMSAGSVEYHGGAASSRRRRRRSRVFTRWIRLS